MSIEHRDIPDANLHEPKGVSIAGANTGYIANGSGSGTWRKLRSTDLQGLTGDSGVANKHIVTDGSNGFKTIVGNAFGSMVITNNSVVAALTAVADTTFNTASQFTVMTGSSFPWSSENLQGITFNTDHLIVPETGIYLISTYLNIGAFPSTAARISMRYKINGSTYGARKPIVKSSGTGAEAQLIGSGLISLVAGDYIQNAIASDASGNLLIKDANISLHLVS